MTERTANIVLLCSSLLVTFLVAEGALRLAGISYPYFTTVDEHRGYALRPYAEGWQRDEGEAYIRINSHGLRDRKRTLEKPNDTFRIAVLGDSFTEARQVPLEDTLVAKLETTLEQCSSQSIETINFGVAGYGTAQSLLTLTHHARAFAPDAVLLLFFAANDVRNNSKALEGKDDVPYFVFNKGTLTLDTSFRENASYRFQRSFMARVLHGIINHSRIAQLLNRLRQTRSQREALPGQEGEMGLDQFVYERHRTEKEEEAWQITEELLQTMQQESTKMDAQFAIALVPASAELGNGDFAYPEERVTALDSEERIPVVPLRSVLKNAQDTSGTAMFGFSPEVQHGHWNAHAQEIAASHLANALCNKWKIAQ